MPWHGLILDRQNAAKTPQIERAPLLVDSRGDGLRRNRSIQKITSAGSILQVSCLDLTYFRIHLSFGYLLTALALSVPVRTTPWCRFRVPEDIHSSARSFCSILAFSYIARGYYPRAGSTLQPFLVESPRTEQRQREHTSPSFWYPASTHPPSSLLVPNERIQDTMAEYETKQDTKETRPSVDVHVVDAHTIGELVSEKSIWNKTRRFIRSIGAEEFGVERITEDLRTNQNPRDLFTVFFSANCNTATLALGFLAPTLFGLGWWDSFLCIIFFNLLGGLWPAAASRFGPKLGLRTMIVPRYAFGWWPSKVLSLLNALNQIGWGMVNCISGAAVLYDIGDGKLPLSICVLIIGLLAIVIGLFGYNIVHHFERWSWMVMLIAFIVVAGFGGSHFVNVPMGSGKAEASSILGMAVAIIGFQVAWLPVASDYAVYMRETTSGTVTFWYTYLGLMFPQIFIELLGAAIGTLTSSSNPRFPEAYEARGIGGLIGSVFDDRGSAARGFGKFIECILGFSTVGVIIINIYSLGIAVQMVSTKLLVIPRLIWSLIGGAIFLAASMAGREHLEEVMENFLLVCAYWIVPFSTVLLLEHFIWRRNYDYDLTAYNDGSKLPYGIAASTAWIIGTVLSLICMSQSWWVGPIAKSIGPLPYGTDISWEIATPVTALVYVPLRYWERKKWGL